MTETAERIRRFLPPHLAEMIPEEALLSIQQTSDDDYLQNHCDSYNAKYGDLDKADNINCERCRNKGDIWEIRDGSIVSVTCPECTNIRRSMALLRHSGLDSHEFSGFICQNEWQRILFELVRDYADKSEGEWLYLGGQSGCGKTHLCTAALREIIFNRHCRTILMKWAEVSKLLKGLVNDGAAYAEKIEPYKNAEILYIDDFFKVKRGEVIKPADINLAFEIIDHRCCMRLKTIISSEFSLDEIISADEATGGRIKQMCGRYSFNIRPDKAKNYRLR